MRTMLARWELGRAPRRGAATALVMALLLSSSSAAAHAQTPPVQTPPLIDSAEAGSPAQIPATPSNPPSAKDRVALDAALAAMSVRNLPLAQQILGQLLLQGETAEARTTAAVILDRLNEWQERQAAGLVPRLVPPTAITPEETDARVPFLATTTLLGFAAWGPTVSIALAVDKGDNDRAFIGVYMVTAASSFIVPYLLTRSARPTSAQANLAFYGGTRGLEWGLMLSNLLFGKAGGEVNGEHERAFAGSLFLGSVAGLTAGTLIAGHHDYTPGQARTVGVMGDYGLFFGFVTGHLLGFDELGDPVVNSPFGFEELSPADRDRRARATSAAGIVGTVAGLAGGRWLSLNRDNTWGDGEVMRASGLLGVLTAGTLGIALHLEDDHEKVLLGLMLAGGGAGLVAGDLLVRNESFTPGQAILVDLAGIAGGLAGLGTTYLVNPDLTATAYMVATTLGAALGGGIMAHLAARGPERVSSNRSAAPTLAILPTLPSAGHTRDVGLRLLGRF